MTLYRYEPNPGFIDIFTTKVNIFFSRIHIKKNPLPHSYRYGLMSVSGTIPYFQVGFQAIPAPNFFSLEPAPASEDILEFF